MWILDNCVLTGIVIFLIFLNYFANRKFYKQANCFPGPKALPLIGNTLFLPGKDISKKYDDFMEILENYPSPCRLWALNQLWVNIYDPQQMKIVLTSSETMNKSDVYKFAKSLFGSGLVHGPTSIWRIHRKLIQPAFNTKILRSYVKIFEKHSKILVKKMSAELNGDEFEVHSYFLNCSLNIVYALKLMTKRRVSIFLHSDIIYQFTQMSKDFDNCVKYIRNAAQDLIQKKRKEILEGVKPKKGGAENKEKSFTELILELQEQERNLTDQDIIDEVNTMLIAGYETVSSALQFLILMLASHPDIQEKVYKELNDIYGDNNPETTSITYANLQRMEYTERVIKESMRLFPPISIISRKAQEDLNIGVHTLPKGSTILLVIAKIHRDEKYWPDPLKFDPDRFLPEEIAKRHPFCYLPFSGGPRNCIGSAYAMIEIKVIMATMIREYVFQKREIQPISNIKLKPATINFPTVPISVRIEKRIFKAAKV